jgi:ketosteroid isomerase-like protein
MRKPLLLALVLLLVALPAAAETEDAVIKDQLDAQYRKLGEAHNRRDAKAIAALKTADFHSILPDGKVSDVEAMREHTKQFLQNNEPPYNIRITIQSLKVSEHKLIAIATVLQEITRTRLIEGQRRKIETSVVQDETWSKAPDGWKLKLVENVRDQKTFVDGKRVDPTKPYDPSAPPYEPPDSTATKKP